MSVTYTLPDKYDATPRNRRRALAVLRCLLDHLEALDVRLLGISYDAATASLSVTLSGPLPPDQRQHIMDEGRDLR